MSVHAIYPALQQRQQFLGCDRELCQIWLLICFALGFCAGSLQTAAFCLAMFLIGFYLLRQMGKADLMLRQIFIRQLKYRPYYPAKDGLCSHGGKRYGR